LTDLTLSCVCFNEGIRYITLLHNLTSLDLSLGNIYHDEISRAIRTLSNLVSLDLSFVEANDEIVEALMHMTQLTRLILNESEDYYEDVEVDQFENLKLLNLRELKTLHADWNIDQFTELRKLHIIYAADILQQTKNLPNLENLLLEQVSLDREQFVEAVCQLTNLTSLSLNKIFLQNFDAEEPIALYLTRLSNLRILECLTYPGVIESSTRTIQIILIIRQILMFLN